MGRGGAGEKAQSAPDDLRRREPIEVQLWSGLVLVAPAVLTIATATAAATAPTAAATATTTASTAAIATTATAAAITTTTTTPATAAASAAVQRGHILGLRAFLSLAYLELDLLTFLELPEASALDRGEVHEAILATIVRRDETVPLLSIEPLHYPCRAHRALSPLAVCS
jgi:hypothetical protein